MARYTFENMRRLFLILALLAWSCGFSQDVFTHPAPVADKTVVAPKLLKQVEAVYPREAVGEVAFLTITVIVRMVVDTTGTPRNMRVEKSMGHAFDEAAMEAVKQWRFEPAMKDGKPINVGMQVAMAFHHP